MSVKRDSNSHAIFQASDPKSDVYNQFHHWPIFLFELLAGIEPASIDYKSIIITDILKEQLYYTLYNLSKVSLYLKNEQCNLLIILFCRIKSLSVKILLFTSLLSSTSGGRTRTTISGQGIFLPLYVTIAKQSPFSSFSKSKR